MPILIWRIVKRVRALSSRLQSDGIPIVSDYSFLETHPGGPDEGWPRWITDQVENSACILIVGSPEWFEAYKGRSEAQTGIGAATEASLIRRLAYSERVGQNRFRLALIDSTEVNEIPLDLRSWHIFRPLSSEKDFKHLQQWLRSKTGIAEPRQTREIVWPSHDFTFQPNIVNRAKEWKLLTSLCSGSLSPAVASVVGPAGIGKTRFVYELREYAKSIGLSFLMIRCSDWTDTWSEISAELPRVAPDFTGTMSPREFRERLGTMSRPLILAFDDYDRASGEEKAEIILPLVEESELYPALGLIICGREVTLSKGTRIAADSLRDVAEWAAWARRSGLDLEDKHMEALVIGGNGNPAVVGSLVNALAAEVAKETGSAVDGAT